MEYLGVLQPLSKATSVKLIRDVEIRSYLSIGCDGSWHGHAGVLVQGTAVHPEFGLLRNDSNELQCVTSSLATTKLEDFFAELIQCYNVLIVHDSALFFVARYG